MSRVWTKAEDQHVLESGRRDVHTYSGRCTVRVPAAEIHQSRRRVGRKRTLKDDVNTFLIISLLFGRSRGERAVLANG